MQPRDICGNKMVPVRQKDNCRPSGERTKVFTDNDFPSVRYNPGDITLELPAEECL